jgi:photosystem II stability/assembly factor-like uncharacterized protein
MAATILIRLAGTLALLAALVVPAAHSYAATLFGLVDTGELYESADGGVSWSIRSTLPVSDAIALAAGATSNDLFLVSERGAFYRSANAGMSWSAISTVTASDVSAFVATDIRFVLVTRSGTVYTSADQGDSWSAVGTITASDIVSVTFDASVYYALTATGTVYRSNDAGASWAAVGAVSISNAVDIVAFSGDLWVLTAAGDLAKSADAGATWTFVSTLSQLGMTTLIRGENELVSSTAGGEIAASAAGASWSWRGVINQLTVRSLATDIPAVTGIDRAGPRSLAFSAPWPNPARESFSFALDLDRDALVRVDLYDMAGRLVARPLPESRLNAGRTVRIWQQQLEPGIYHLRAREGDRERVRRIVLIGR